MDIYLAFNLQRSLTFFWLSWSLIAVGQDTLTIDRLDYRFMTYEGQTLSPLTSPENSEVAGLFISCKDYEQIEFCGTHSFSVWVDGRLMAESQNGNCIYLKLEALCQLVNKENPYLTVVSKKTLLGVTARAISIMEEEADLESSMLVRDSNDAPWIFGFLFGTILLVMVRAVRPVNRWRFQRPNLKEFSKRFLTLENLVLTTLLSIISSFCYSYLSGNFELFVLAKHALTILLVAFGKSILTLLSGATFNHGRWASWQLNFGLLFWLITTLVVFGVLFLDFIFFSNSELSIEVALYVWSISSLLLLLLIAIVFMSQKGLKNLHIFIYLCTTEILPIALLVYLLLE